MFTKAQAVIGQTTELVDVPFAYEIPELLQPFRVDIIAGDQLRRQVRLREAGERDMRARLLLTTTALTVGMLLPSAASALDVSAPAPVIQTEVAAPDTGQTRIIQDFRHALAKLEDAQQRFEQAADGNTRYGALAHATADTRDAVVEIERSLQQYPDPAHDPEVSSTRRAIDQTRAVLQHDRRPQQVARVLGALHSAVMELQQTSVQ